MTFFYFYGYFFIFTIIPIGCKYSAKTITKNCELAEDIHPQLLDARAKYTDYVEPVAEEVVATGDDGWD